MNVIYYKRRGGELECDSLSVKDGESCTELRFDCELFGKIKLGEVLKKIEGKSCIFNTGSLPDGIYAPKIHLSSSVLSPEPFEILSGKPRLLPRSDEYIRALARRIDAILSDNERIKKTLSEHDEKINGNPLF